MHDGLSEQTATAVETVIDAAEDSDDAVEARADSCG